MSKHKVQTIDVPLPSNTSVTVDVFVAASSTQSLEIGNKEKLTFNSSSGLQFVKTLQLQTGNSSAPVPVSIKHSTNGGKSWGGSLLDLSDLVQFGPLNRLVVVSEDDRDGGTDSHLILHFLWWGERRGTLPTSSDVPFTLPATTSTIYAIGHSDASYEQKVELFLDGHSKLEIVGTGSPYKYMGFESTGTENATSALARFSYKESQNAGWKSSKAWGGSVVSLGDYREITAITEDWVDDDYNDTIATFMWLDSTTVAAKAKAPAKGSPKGGSSF